MATILTDEQTPDGSASQEASHRQVALIYQLIDARYVSEKCASRIINLLSDQPLVNANGLENLKDILRQ